ncbi:MAG: signal peptidase II [Erysipelotrichaceae bacterium]|nr:signal peptidase II [Erysipelotrichaceae bacterium]
MKIGEKMKKTEVIVLFGLLILDQITKIVVETQMQLWESIEVIPNFFYITYAQNTGAAWSILEGKMWLFYLITLVALGALIYYFIKTDKKHVWMRYTIIFLLAGALGNFIDRVTLQYVRDFLDFYIFGYNFPIFNVADSILCIGVAMLAVDTFFIKENEHGRK